MAKFNPPTINSGYLSTEALNSALVDISVAIENSLSRDGSSPNQMEADLDLNGYNIINAGVTTGSPNSLLTYGQMTEYVDAHASGIVLTRVEKQTATSAQEIFTLTTMEYTPNSNNLAVYVDGVRKFSPDDFVETDPLTVTFTVGQTLGAEVQFVSNEFVSNIALPTHTHTWSQIIGAPVYTTRWPDYSEVTGKPSTFTPSSHTHTAADITSGRLADARRGVFVQATQPSSPTTGDVWLW